MKLQITGASTFVNRMFEACGTYQWAREFLKNSIDANATKVEFGIEWQAVEKTGIYRRTIIDDGCGMNRDELRKFFSTLGEGARRIGGIHDNFGVGAKIASLPWNPNGLVVISYKNGQASMIWIVLDPDSGDYELVEFEDEGRKACVVEPTILDDGIDWAALRPEWVKDHGTIIILIGSDEYPDTVLGNPYAGEKDIKGLSVYLNTRFWDLSGVDTKVVELRSDKKSQWPQSVTDKDDARRPNNRQILGARHWLTDVKAQNGKLVGNGIVELDEHRVNTEWYLWEGERPAIHSYAKKPGYIAFRYNGELYQLTSNKIHFRWFGVIESKVQQNLSIILEPQHYQASNGRWGVHPDQSRNRLIFTGNGEKGVELPLADWGLEFLENIPDRILEAIRKTREDSSGSINDDNYRKRLQDKFGNRWMMKVLVKARQMAEANTQPGTVTEQEVSIVDPPETLRPRRKKRRKVTCKVIRRTVTRSKAFPGGNGETVEREMPVDIPLYRFVKADEFDNPWHLAVWVPNDPDGPTVLLNIESPILQEVIEYHQGQYPDILHEEVANTVMEVFGEVASCKIAHSQKLTRHVPEEELDADYRSEKALTVALMGLIAEESLIAQRLGKLGRKKAVPVAT